jgi:hypothetical protein
MAALGCLLLFVPSIGPIKNTRGKRLAAGALVVFCVNRLVFLAPTHPAWHEAYVVGVALDYILVGVSFLGAWIAWRDEKAAAERAKTAARQTHE